MPTVRSFRWLPAGGGGAMKPPPGPRRRYTLVVALERTDDEAAEMRALRTWLKRLCRGYGVRCLSIQPETSEKKTDDRTGAET